MGLAVPSGYVSKRKAAIIRRQLTFLETGDTRFLRTLVVYLERARLSKTSFLVVTHAGALPACAALFPELEQAEARIPRGLVCKGHHGFAERFHQFAKPGAFYQSP